MTLHWKSVFNKKITVRNEFKQHNRVNKLVLHIKTRCKHLDNSTSASFSIDFIIHFRQLWTKWAIFWKTDLFLKKKRTHRYFRPKIHLIYKKGSLQLIMWKKNQKKSVFQFLPIFFFIFSKKPKISNLSRDKAPKFQNYVIADMKTALHGGKKVKTQISRRTGRRKIQKESYWTSKKL